MEARVFGANEWIDELLPLGRRPHDLTTCLPDLGMNPPVGVEVQTPKAM